ncbi:hypothetical protein [Dysgonomonas massiliensis]|uniref:hypothetical protein n=1 Tax=Dysgonomonas massiliensis TaxID=2040292 RepID=UPI000C772CB5|nr:hypothetical protein [Dysgonomonas massiliensis]
MKTDLYTKIVLTVIAVALVANFFKDNSSISSAYAQDKVPAPAPIERQIIDVNLVQVNGIDLYERLVNLKDGTKAGYIPVSLESVDANTSTFNVNVKDIDDSFVVEDSFFSNRKYIRTFPSE